MRDESGFQVGRGCAARAGAPRGRGSAHGVVATARPTTRRLQSIPRHPHAMESGTARLRGRPHRMLRTRVVLGRAAPGPLLTPPPSSSPPKTPHGSYSAKYASGPMGALTLVPCALGNPTTVTSFTSRAARKTVSETIVIHNRVRDSK